MDRGVTGLTLALRSKGDPLSFVPSLRAAVAGPTDDQPVYMVRATTEVISRSLAEHRFMMLVLIVFASVALLLAAVGLVAGLAASVMLTRFLGSLLYGVGVGDPLTLAAVTVVLGAVAALVCLLPAKRAISVDPAVALRCE